MLAARTGTRTGHGTGHGTVPNANSVSHFSDSDTTAISVQDPIRFCQQSQGLLPLTYFSLYLRLQRGCPRFSRGTEANFLSPFPK
eukprot:803309-Prymnesium_polylepis.1